MKVLIQRVKKASVTIDGALSSSIGKGILALVGIEKGDTLEQVQKAAKKISGLRIFPDENDKMNKTEQSDFFVRSFRFFMRVFF